MSSLAYDFGPSHFIKLDESTIIHALINIPHKRTKAVALVFLHHWGGSSRLWCQVVREPIMMDKHMTVCLDFPGWGQSSGTSQSAQDYSTTAYALDVLRVLTLLPNMQEGFILVGHAMGAKVAMAVAGHKPTGLKAVILLAPAALGSWHLPAQLKEHYRYAIDNEEQMRSFRALTPSPTTLGDDIQILVDDALKGSDAAKQGWLDHGMGEDVFQGWSGDGLRTLVITGTEDDAFGATDQVEEATRFQTHVVDFFSGRGFDVSYSVLEGVGHFLPLLVPHTIMRATMQLAEAVRESDWKSFKFRPSLDPIESLEALKAIPAWEKPFIDEFDDQFKLPWMADSLLALKRKATRPIYKYTTSGAIKFHPALLEASTVGDAAQPGSADWEGSEQPNARVAEETVKTRRRRRVLNPDVVSRD